MQKDSNKFTFIFSAVMVIVVAILLSVAAISLDPFQKRNIRIEKMENILSTIQVQSTTANAEALFSEYIKEQLVLNHKGQPLTNTTPAFEIDLKKELDKARTGQQDQQLFPLFVANKKGENFYIIPVRGKGLWGPIWGYVALNGDMNTIYGVNFGHKSETPGLGAEIATFGFQQKFNGKKIFDEVGKYISVKVIKGGAGPGDMHGVDAVSGATITSNGVSEMIYRTLNNYIPYFKSKNKMQPVAVVKNE